MDEIEKFQREVEGNIQGLGEDKLLQALSQIWLRDTARHKWSYNFTWMGRPAIQLPNDTWAMQELVWKIRPDLIIESGIAHGGSLIYYASLLALLDLCEVVESGVPYHPTQTQRKVLGLDIDIRAHNRQAIENHPMFNWIKMLQGSSVAPETIEQVVKIAKNHKRILVSLDSSHTHDHVLAELEAYAPLVSPGSYCVVFDTVLEDMPPEQCFNRPWAPGNSPKTAVWEFLQAHPEFEIDHTIEHKLLITVAPDGFLKRIK
jgi:cephalosporin hydroxylase